MKVSYLLSSMANQMVEAMDSMLRLIDTELADMEEEENFWEQAIYAGPCSLQAQRNPMKPSQGGSVCGKRPNKLRKRSEGFQWMVADYFALVPVYDSRDFRRRFRMTRRLFDRISREVCAHDEFFVQRMDACGLHGLASAQKITAALRQLALGIGADATDEYCRIGESTARKSLYRFCKAIRELYESTYLRKPTTEDVRQKLAINAERGFPGMFASLDCMHYIWKNCPVAWQGQFTDKDGKKSIVLEGIADQELWLWHAFFGLPGGNNDITVLDRSPLVQDILHGDYAARFTINGRDYSQAYLLVDGIYPRWTCFVKSFHKPQTQKKTWFAKCQESCRKDVERAFGVLQARWGIVKQPARSWDRERITDILMCCVILHNMIIEDERGEEHEDLSTGADVLPVSRGRMPWSDYLQKTAELESQDQHYQLRNDLIEHLWTRKGDD